MKKKQYFVLRVFILFLAISSIFAAYIFDKKFDEKEKKNYGSMFVVNSSPDSIIDSDTFSVDVESYPYNFPYIFRNNIHIQLEDINTPKLNGQCEKENALAQETMRVLKEILHSAERIELKEMRRGDCFCIIARAYADGKNLSTELIRLNLAVPSEGNTKKDWCI